LPSFTAVPIEHVEVKPEELKLAPELVEQSANEDLIPDGYHDDVRQRILDLIQHKLEGEGITLTLTDEPEHKIIDIMEALKASLADADRKPAKQASGKKNTKKKPAKKRAKG